MSLVPFEDAPPIQETQRVCAAPLASFQSSLKTIDAVLWRRELALRPAQRAGQAPRSRRAASGARARAEQAAERECAYLVRREDLVDDIRRERDEGVLGGHQVDDEVERHPCVQPVLCCAPLGSGAPLPQCSTFFLE